ncbi:MAG TPA: glutathione S-transferase family protein [Burkholderiaceae bacterium]|nr:glutathione S-transferase family protein [Burkholderiaceae bacterium]
MKLYIGNKNYSSWSMRPWLLMTQLGMQFEEVKLSLDFREGSVFKTTIARVSPAARVPVLVDDDGFTVWDSLAILEYLAERFPANRVWPQEMRHRARARSLCAEMHSGFVALRNHCPMNIEASLPEIGPRVIEEQPDLRRDLQRIEDMWREQLDAAGGPFLFGDFCAADAFYAPVCSRIRTYALPVSKPVHAYVERIFALPAMRQWVDAALAEGEFLEKDEPYRHRPSPAE